MLSDGMSDLIPRSCCEAIALFGNVCLHLACKTGVLFCQRNTGYTESWLCQGKNWGALRTVTLAGVVTHKLSLSHTCLLLVDSLGTSGIIRSVWELRRQSHKSLKLLP